MIRISSDFVAMVWIWGILELVFTVRMLKGSLWTSLKGNSMWPSIDVFLIKRNHLPPLPQKNLSSVRQKIELCCKLPVAETLLHVFVLDLSYSKCKSINNLDNLCKSLSNWIPMEDGALEQSNENVLMKILSSPLKPASSNEDCIQLLMLNAGFVVSYCNFNTFKFGGVKF